MAKKPITHTTTTGATYERLPWPGLNLFRRAGGCCPFCLVSLASHDAIGCDLTPETSKQLEELL